MHSLVNAGHSCGGGATLRCSNLFLSPNIFIYDHLLETNGSVADVTTFVSPDRAKRDIWEIILGVFMANSGQFYGQGAIL